MTGQTTEGFFYNKRDALTRAAAEKILAMVASRVGPLRSVIDVGCGVGTWLRVAQDMGASQVLGMEGPWIRDSGAFVIDAEKVQVYDLEAEWFIRDRFQLGISLEVAEHLGARAGDHLVEQLAKACEVVLFSAAIPGQQGNGHINEQLPTYWQNRFERYGMEAIDYIRPLVQDDDTIPWWYRQNIVVYARPSLARRFYDSRWQALRRRGAPLRLVCLHHQNPGGRKSGADTAPTARVSFFKRCRAYLSRTLRNAD